MLPLITLSGRLLTVKWHCLQVQVNPSNSSIVDFNFCTLHKHLEKEKKYKTFQMRLKFLHNPHTHTSIHRHTVRSRVCSFGHALKRISPALILSVNTEGSGQQCDKHYSLSFPLSLSLSSQFACLPQQWVWFFNQNSNKKVELKIV